MNSRICEAAMIYKVLGQELSIMWFTNLDGILHVENDKYQKL